MLLPQSNLFSAVDYNGWCHDCLETVRMSCPSYAVVRFEKNLFACKHVCGLLVCCVGQQLPHQAVMRYYNCGNTTPTVQTWHQRTPPSAGYNLHFYAENHSYLRLIFFSRSSSLRSVDFSVFSFCNFLLMRSLIFSLLSESYSSSASPSSMSPSDSSSPWQEHVQIYDHCQRRSTDHLDFALHTSAVSPDFFPFFLLKQNYEGFG